MDKPLLGYDLYFLEDFSNSYFFETALGIKYEVKFKPFTYLFSNPYYANNTFEFVIDINYNPTDKRPPLDRRTSKTIADIFEDFFQKKDDTITVYVCDSSDSRQIARSRKFHIWFEEFQRKNFVKYDLSLIDSEGVMFPISIILHSKNPYKIQIFKEFDDIAEGYNTEK